MPFVMLRREWPSQFRRTLRSGKKPLTMTFPPGDAVEVTEKEFEELRPDVGQALMEVVLDEKGRARVANTA